MLCGVRLCNPMDCSLPGTSVHGILQSRIVEGVAMQGIVVIPGIVVIQGSSLGLLHCRQTLYHLSPPGSPGFVVSHPHLLLRV